MTGNPVLNPVTALLLRSTPGDNGYSIWISDVARKTVNRLTQDSDRAATGAVSPDGKDVLISTTTGYVSNLTRKSLSASGAEEKVLENFNGNLVLFDISRDGRYLLFNHQDPKAHLHDGSAGREKARPSAERSLGRTQRPRLPR